jgi:S-adenosylmethionine/arginine decarboxylase-like enzyme
MTERRRGQGATEEFYARARARGDWDGDDEYASRDSPPPFGYLLALDLYGCKDIYLCDLGRAYGFLEALVLNLGVQKQAPPAVFLSPPEYTDKVGISGWVPLIESGIQLHTLQPRRYASVVIFCCRPINEKAVREVAKGFYEPSGIESRRIVCGHRYYWAE